VGTAGPLSGAAGCWEGAAAAHAGSGSVVAAAGGTGRLVAADVGKRIDAPFCTAGAVGLVAPYCEGAFVGWAP
jgi:hypothetical protein